MITGVVKIRHPNFLIDDELVIDTEDLPIPSSEFLVLAQYQFLRPLMVGYRESNRTQGKATFFITQSRTSCIYILPSCSPSVGVATLWADSLRFRSSIWRNPKFDCTIRLGPSDLFIARKTAPWETATVGSLGYGKSMGP